MSKKRVQVNFECSPQEKAGLERLARLDRSSVTQFLLNKAIGKKRRNELESK